MKVLFVSEYFPPYAPGGAEWSAYYLAKGLQEKDLADVLILTPNLGKASNKEDLNIKYFPFYKKTKITSEALTPFYFTNPVWILWCALQVLINAQKFHADIIHVQGKYSIVSAILANFFLRKKYW